MVMPTVKATPLCVPLLRLLYTPFPPPPSCCLPSSALRACKLIYEHPLSPSAHISSSLSCHLKRNVKTHIISSASGRGRSGEGGEGAMTTTTSFTQNSLCLTRGSCSCCCCCCSSPCCCCCCCCLWVTASPSFVWSLEYINVPAECANQHTHAHTEKHFHTYRGG